MSKGHRRLPGGGVVEVNTQSGEERENEKEQHGSNRSTRERGVIHRDAGQEFFKLGKIYASDDLQIKVSSRINKTKLISRISGIKLEISIHTSIHTHNNVCFFIRLVSHLFCTDDIARPRRH